MAKKSAAFPVGLYGMMLFALAWLTLPSVFAPLERWLVGSACLVPRFASLWFGEPAVAADRDALALIRSRGRELQRRVERHDFAGGGATMPAGHSQLLCGVLAVQRTGGGGEPSELILDHSYRELEGCERVVTKGEALLGFLMQPGRLGALDDEPNDPARVMLCNHRYAPRVLAALDGDELEPLRFVVRPALVVDPAPLKVELWDNPYRAARLQQAHQVVRTRESPAAGVPAGLVLGRTRIWGYPGAVEDDALAIGVFVSMAAPPQALSHVVLWRRPGSAPASRRAALARAGDLRRRERAEGVVYDLPGQRHGRHLLVTSAAVPDGAAVVQDGLFLGSAQGLRFGAALVTSFASSRQAWSLLYLPDDPDGDPVELFGRIERSGDGDAWLRWQGPQPGEPPLAGRGTLFTGSNGQYCPAGLWIGRAEPDPWRPELLRVQVPTQRGPRRVEVYVAAERS